MERYTGFYIDKPQGNNVFSYEERENKKIFVPKLIEGTLEDVKVGDNIVFNEIDEDTEIKAKGLKNLVEYKLGNKTIYVFDNHNHAFYFWNKSSVFILHSSQFVDTAESRVVLGGDQVGADTPGGDGRTLQLEGLDQVLIQIVGSRYDCIRKACVI